MVHFRNPERELRASDAGGAPAHGASRTGARATQPSAVRRGAAVLAAVSAAGVLPAIAMFFLLDAPGSDHQRSLLPIILVGGLLLTVLAAYAAASAIRLRRALDDQRRTEQALR